MCRVMRKPVVTQTEMYKHRRWLEAGNFRFSQGKGADQLHSKLSNCEAHLHLCFRICKMLVFPFLVMQLKGSPQQLRCCKCLVCVIDRV